MAEEKELKVKEWFETVTEAMKGEVEIKEESDEIIIAICKASKEKELFALKMRDAGSSAGYQMLLKKGLIPQDGMHHIGSACFAWFLKAATCLWEPPSVNEYHGADSDDEDFDLPDPEELGIDPW